MPYLKKEFKKRFENSLQEQKFSNYLCADEIISKFYKELNNRVDNIESTITEITDKKEYNISLQGEKETKEYKLILK